MFKKQGELETVSGNVIQTTGDCVWFKLVC